MEPEEQAGRADHTDPEAAPAEVVAAGDFYVPDERVKFVNSATSFSVDDVICPTKTRLSITRGI